MFTGKKSAQIREILISESAWEEMTCLFAPSRDLLLERTYSGIARARDAGKRFGRPPVLNEEQKQKVLERIKSGASISAIAREFRTTRQTILRVRAKQQTVTV